MAKVVETQANLERQLELIETHQEEVVFIISIFVFLGTHEKNRANFEFTLVLVRIKEENRN